jgi:hypothetical protein
LAKTRFLSTINFAHFGFALTQFNKTITLLAKTRFLSTINFAHFGVAHFGFALTQNRRTPGEVLSGGETIAPCLNGKNGI